MKNTMSKNIFQFILLSVLIVFAFWFALKDDMKEVLINVRHVSIFWLIIVLAMGVLYYALQGYMLYTIGKKYKHDLTFLDGLENAYCAAFFNGVTPLGGGQVAQAYVFHKKHVSYRDIASILWKDFFVYQSVVVLFALVLLLVFMPFCFEMFPQWIWLVYLGLIIDASVIVILWTMSHFPALYAKISSIFVNLLHRMHIVKNKNATLEKWNYQVHYFADEVKSLKKDKKLLIKGILINIFRQVIYYSIPFFVGIGLGIPLDMGDFILVLLLSCCIHMLNALTPLPGDTGWTESVFIIIFGFVFQRVYASSIMILWRMATYYIHIMIGGITFLVVKSRKKQIEGTSSTNV
ncbi:lysylphosphatidylglycerol synthase transmembrane domain-containing protein [Amedibacillus sp. YH-ame6]